MRNIKSSLAVGIIQQACTQDQEQNLAVTITAIQQAAAQGAQLVLLQELHTNLYFCQTENTASFDLAETIPGPSTEKLGNVARQLNIVIVASLFEKRAPGLYHNTAVVLERNGSIAGCYRKMHIPDDPGYYEKFYFTPGDLGFQPITTSIGRLGVLICWDQWYPEAARLMALAGAEILLYPTAIGWSTQEDSEAEKIRQCEAWTFIQRAHAIANGLPVIVANRTGFEATTTGATQGIHFWGSSFAAGPQGEMLISASQAKPETLVVAIDLSRSENVRRSWPFLRDRRIDHYQEIIKRYVD
jgi:N-carbamoylputrescine amidase